jgi:hypothetical protein
MLDVYIGYITPYTLRTKPRVLPNGELEQECATVRDGLREENRPVFKARMRGQIRG